jgi:hypothetical protein
MLLRRALCPSTMRALAPRELDELANQSFIKANGTSVLVGMAPRHARAAPPPQSNGRQRVLRHACLASPEPFARSGREHTFPGREALIHDAISSSEIAGRGRALAGHTSRSPAAFVSGGPSELTTNTRRSLTPSFETQKTAGPWQKSTPVSVPECPCKDDARRSQRHRYAPSGVAT